MSHSTFHISETCAFPLDAVIDHIAHWLPAQGPLKDFIHHNTLHAVQNRPFPEHVLVAVHVGIDQPPTLPGVILRGLAPGNLFEQVKEGVRFPQSDGEPQEIARLIEPLRKEQPGRGGFDPLHRRAPQ